MPFVNVAGKTAVTTGSMGDAFGIDDCQFTGNFAANLGADGDAFHLDTDPAAPGKTEFLGNLSINAGAGADAVTVAGPEAMEATAVYVYGTVAITGAETLTINPVNAHHVGHATFP